MSVRDTASCTGISEGSVQTMLKKRLDLRKVCARWVPHLLTEEQKTQRLKCARELLKTCKGCNSRVISNLLTGDEIWVHMFEPQKRADNKQWKRIDKKCPCIAKRTISSKKMLYAIFFKSSGPVVRALSIWSYSHWPILQEFCTEESERVLQKETTKQRMVRSPPFMRVLSLFWLLKRCKFQTIHLIHLT